MENSTETPPSNQPQAATTAAKSESSIWFKWNAFKEGLKPPVRFGVEIVEFIATLLFLLIIIRQGVFERRYIPSGSMLPNLQIQDQLIVEKVSQNLFKLGIGNDFRRGDIVVFYPPSEAERGKDIQHDFWNTFVRLTGISSDIQLGSIVVFPFLPKAETAYIKRIVALPGEKVEIRANDGIYINGVKLPESYVLQPASYSLYTLGDLFNSSLACGTPLVNNKEYAGSKEAIIVPEGHYFCLGDNRNDSRDGHCWGFVKKDRIIGKAFSIIWRDLRLQPSFTTMTNFPFESSL